MQPTPTQPADSTSGLVCTICQWPIQSGEEKTTCPACRTEYHTTCWQENGGCGVYGCKEVPPTEKLQEIEIPVSYWGQENKPCPACGTSILAAAMRCRHCGTQFTSAQPEDASRFAERMMVKAQADSLRGKAVAMFVFGLIPLTAPLAALVGIIWYPLQRKAIQALPPFHRVLCRLGLIVAVAQTLLFILLAGLFSILGSQ